MFFCVVVLVFLSVILLHMFMMLNVLRYCITIKILTKSIEIPHRGGAMFNSNKTPKLEKNDMANKICEEKVFVPSNGLKM